MRALKSSPLKLVVFVFVFGAAMSCSSIRTPESSSNPAPFQTATPDRRCASTEAPLVRVPSRAAGEPLLAVPKPAGWTFSTEGNSPWIRGVVLNSKLEAHNFTPSFLITLANVTQDASTPEQALDTERAGLAQKAGIDRDTAGTLCGYPSRVLTYESEGRAGTTLMIAAQDGHNEIWIPTVASQTADPDNPEYLAAKHTIFDGFQFGLPSNSQ